MVSCVGEGLAHLAHHDALVVRDKAFQFGDPEEALKEEFANFFWDFLHTLVVGLWSVFVRPVWVEQEVAGEEGGADWAGITGFIFGRNSRGSDPCLKASSANLGHKINEESKM